jgi:hypothetical protein
MCRRSKPQISMRCTSGFGACTSGSGADVRRKSGVLVLANHGTVGNAPARESIASHMRWLVRVAPPYPNTARSGCLRSEISPIMSPACVLTMPPPRILPWPRPARPPSDLASGESSNSSLVTPSSRPLAIARPAAAQVNRPFLTLMPYALAWSSVRPTQATSGLG